MLNLYEVVFFQFEVLFSAFISCVVWWWLSVRKLTGCCLLNVLIVTVCSVLWLLLIVNILVIALVEKEMALLCHSCHWLCDNNFGHLRCCRVKTRTCNRK